MAINLNEYKKDYYREDFFKEEELYGDTETNILNDFIASKDAMAANKERDYLDKVCNLTQVNNYECLPSDNCIYDDIDVEDVDTDGFNIYQPDTVDLSVVDNFRNPEEEITVLQAEDSADKFIESLQKILNKL